MACGAPECQHTRVPSGFEPGARDGRRLAPRGHLALGRRIGSGRGPIDQGGVFRVDGRSNSTRAHPIGVHLHHGTRDAETDLSGWSHRVEDDRAVAIDSPDVAVPVASMSCEVTAAAKTGHVAHQLAVGDLELIEPPDLRAGLGHIDRPDNLGEIPVRLRGRLVLGEASCEALWLRSPFRSTRATGCGADGQNERSGDHVPPRQHKPMLVLARTSLVAWLSGSD